LLVRSHAAEQQDGLAFQQTPDKHRPIAVSGEQIVEVNVFKHKGRAALDDELAAGFCSAVRSPIPSRASLSTKRL
jgi:hypothetical protein